MFYFFIDFLIGGNIVFIASPLEFASVCDGGRREDGGYCR